MMLSAELDRTYVRNHPLRLGNCYNKHFTNCRRLYKISYYTMRTENKYIVLVSLISLTFVTGEVGVSNENKKPKCK